MDTRKLAMSEIKTVLTCPLGSTCEEIKNGEIHRCVWYITLMGKNPQTDEDINDKGCAMAWMPILLVENSRQQKSTAAAVESLRNENVSMTNKLTETLIGLAKFKALQNKGTQE